MSDVGATGSNVYQVAGYKEGDRIGAGVVVDPAKLTKGNNDTKLVAVDLDLNGKVDPTDDQVVVKLPPKGVVPVNWNGVARLEGGGKTGYVLKESLKPILAGAGVGATVGTFATFPQVAKTMSGDPLGASIGLPILGAVVGYGIGYAAGNETDKHKTGMLGMGIGAAGVAAITHSVNGAPKALLVVGALALAGAATVGISHALGKTQEVSEDAQKARASSVPDMVPPKFILNQYLMKQNEGK